MITSERRDGVGVIRIDRHDRRNALDIEHCDALREAAEALVSDGHRALVVTGHGSSFCSGADLVGVYGEGFRTALYGMLHGLAALPVPVIAAVNGPAIGAGTQLAIACDLRVASVSATFSVPTARNGLAVDPWTVRRLGMLAGGGGARAVLLGAANLDASRAHTLGLVDRLGDLDDALLWAQEISGFAPLSLRYSKAALEALFEPDLAAGSRDALEEAFEACWRSEDLAEGNRARAEKRTPRFQGR